ncbi:MAG TPA: hypothetical protein VFA06_03010 [Actinocrinis sp.]|uniref:hypothetical protein n=1 Tax=Actinocrinis sp. TaxID=1920516 RepID=UPI002D37E937|nr:hypothetical protein [Actinocrinis sp.]HZU54818.1 hypothetical protein [Actinocrinis sp.]
MTPEIEAVLIGAGTTAVTSAIAWTVNQVFKRRDVRAAAADAARNRDVQALEALMRDAQEVRFNLGVLQNQWSGWRARAPQAMQALAHALGGYMDGKRFAGLADAFGVVAASRSAEFDSNMLLLIEPLQRLGASVAHIASLPDVEVREVANRVGNAVGGLAQAAIHRPGHASRVKAEEEFDAAIIELGEVMRSRGQPRPKTPSDSKSWPAPEVT